MRNYFLLLLFAAMFSATFSGCKKDEDDDDNNNIDPTTCPGKYEGIYRGTVTYFNGTVYNNVEVSVHVSGTGSNVRIVLGYNLAPADTLYATINCDLRSFTIPQQSQSDCTFEGYGTFSADGNTLTYNVSNNGSGCGPSNLDGVFTKISNAGFILLMADEVKVAIGQNASVPVKVQKVGTFNGSVTLSAETDVPAGYTTALGVSSGTPTFTSNLTVTRSGSATADNTYVIITAVSGTDTVDHYLDVTYFDSNCANNILGSYTGLDCFGDNSTVTITSVSSTQVKITCTYSSFVEDFLATFDCDNNILTIPRQFLISDPSYEIQGDGYFYRTPGTTDYVFNLNTVYYNSGQSQVCTYLFN